MDRFQRHQPASQATTLKQLTKKCHVIRDTFVPEQRLCLESQRLVISAMKSAYELAMERLAKSDPDAGKPLSAEQKARLADIDTLYKGKIAEREIFLKKQLNEALSEGKYEESKKSPSN